MRRSLAGMIFMIVASAGAWNCRHSAPPPARQDDARVAQAKPVAEARPVAPKIEAPAPAPQRLASAHAAALEAPPEPGEKGLGRAYVAIYCAQRHGEATKLLAIYKQYGFDDPKAWTKAWTKAAKDAAWVAQVTRAAIKKCP